MDYKDGEVYLSSRNKEMIANAILNQIWSIASVRDMCGDLGLNGYDFDFQISNYQALLNKLAEE